MKTHGLTLESLEERGARKITYGDTRKLANYLNKHQNLPIVAFNASYDRDDVLWPAFRKVGNAKGFPAENRWVCTCELAKERSDLVPADLSKNLDSLLGHFGLEKRDETMKHDAYIDC